MTSKPPKLSPSQPHSNSNLTPPQRPGSNRNRSRTPSPSPSQQSSQNQNQRTPKSSKTTTTSSTNIQTQDFASTSKPSKSSWEEQTPAAIPLLANSLSQTYRHIHPILLLSIFVARFQATVVDPIRGMTELLVPLVLLQGLYCAICLPPSSNNPSTTASTAATSSSSTTSTPSKAAGENTPAAAFKRRRTANQIPNPSVVTIPTLLTLLSSAILPTLPLYALITLHGAPLASHHIHTLLLSLHLSLLSTPSLFYTIGLAGSEASARWKRVLSGTARIDACTAAWMGALLGAWVGAVPIPLDWDRDWQAWPLTVLAGAWAGAAVGGWVGGLGGVWGRGVSWE